MIFNACASGVSLDSYYNSCPMVVIRQPDVTGVKVRYYPTKDDPVESAQADQCLINPPPILQSGVERNWNVKKGISFYIPKQQATDLYIFVQYSEWFDNENYLGISLDNEDILQTGDKTFT